MDVQADTAGTWLRSERFLHCCCLRFRHLCNKPFKLARDIPTAPVLILPQYRVLPGITITPVEPMTPGRYFMILQTSVHGLRRPTWMSISRLQSKLVLLSMGAQVTMMFLFTADPNDVRGYRIIRLLSVLGWTMLPTSSFAKTTIIRI